MHNNAFIALPLCITLIYTFSNEEASKGLFTLLGYIEIITLFKTYFKISLLLFCFIIIFTPTIEITLQFIPNMINFQRKVTQLTKFLNVFTHLYQVIIYSCLCFPKTS